MHTSDITGTYGMALLGRGYSEPAAHYAMKYYAIFHRPTAGFEVCQVFGGPPALRARIPASNLAEAVSIAVGLVAMDEGLQRAVRRLEEGREVVRSLNEH